MEIKYGFYCRNCGKVVDEVREISQVYESWAVNFNPANGISYGSHKVIDSEVVSIEFPCGGEENLYIVEDLVVGYFRLGDIIVGAYWHDWEVAKEWAESWKLFLTI